MANGEYNYKLSEFIVVMRNLVPAAKCAEVIDTCKKSPFWEMSRLGPNGDVDLDFRRVKEIYLTSDHVKLLDPKLDEIDKDLFDYVKIAGDLYSETLQKSRGIKFTPEFAGDEGYKILQYLEGYFFKEHCDNGPGTSRVLTLTINLNEDYDGGLFRFLSGEFDVDLKTGDAVMFPSTFMFPHEVTEITRGERYSMVTWFH